MRTTLRLIKMCVKRRAEYKLDFILTCIAVTPIHLTQMFFSWIIAKRFGGVAGWDTLDLIFLYGVLLTSYSVAQIFFRHFRYIDESITSGSLDLCFIRPIPITYYMIFFNLNVMEIISQLFPSVAILVVVCVRLDVGWSLAKIMVLISALVGGALIQSCLFVAIGLISFWTIKSSQLENIFYAFKDFCNYPIDIYGRYITGFLTFVLPMAFVNYYPARFILDKPSGDSIINFLTMPVSLILLGITTILWKKALRNYSSTGS